MPISESFSWNDLSWPASIGLSRLRIPNESRRRRLILMGCHNSKSHLILLQISMRRRMDLLRSLAQGRQLWRSWKFKRNSVQWGTAIFNNWKPQAFLLLLFLWRSSMRVELVERSCCTCKCLSCPLVSITASRQVQFNGAVASRSSQFSSRNSWNTLIF